MSFIKESRDDDKMAMSDVILVLVLVVGGLGLWWYTSSSKSQSFEAFAQAEKLLEEEKYEEAFDAWFELQKISYKSDSLDSLLYENLSFVEELKEGNIKSFRSIDSLLKISPIHHTKIQQNLKMIQEPYFLQSKQAERVVEWRKRFGVAMSAIHRPNRTSPSAEPAEPAEPTEAGPKDVDINLESKSSNKSK